MQNKFVHMYISPTTSGAHEAPVQCRKSLGTEFNRAIGMEKRKLLMLREERRGISNLDVILQSRALKYRAPGFKTRGRRNHSRFRLTQKFNCTTLTIVAVNTEILVWLGWPVSTQRKQEIQSPFEIGGSKSNRLRSYRRLIIFGAATRNFVAVGRKSEESKC